MMSSLTDGSIDDLKIRAVQLIKDALLKLETIQTIPSCVVDVPIELQISKASRQHLVVLGLPEIEIRQKSLNLANQWKTEIINLLNDEQSSSSSVPSQALLFDSRSPGVINVFIKSVEHAPAPPEDDNHLASDALTFPVRKIGTIWSCFRTKYASPRQGSFVPSSRGVVELDKHLSPEFLDGLEDFSHCWLIWLFHQARTDENNRLKPLIKPPKLQGVKKGVFATRSPHRPSPVGLSVVRIESISTRQIIISGLDLIDGTPLLDIKPYHPLDIISSHDLKYPSWIRDVEGNECAVLNDVVIPDGVREYLDGKFIEQKEKKSKFGGVGPFRFFDSVERFLQAVTESLKLDPRTIQQHRQKKGDENVFFMDNFDIFYVVDDLSKSANVLRIVHKSKLQ